MRKLLFAHHSCRIKASRVSIVAAVSFACLLRPVTVMAAPTITYVQGNYGDPQVAETSVTITFTAAQVAGDLNVIAVGWNDSVATVSKITDQSNNTYTLAVGPTVQSGFATQSIYYAKSIAAAAAGANSVTVTFSTAAAYPDIRILEYSGADPNNPVDVTAASSGNSATSSSGSATTTNATDLIFAANLVQSTTTGPGANFTTRLLTQPDGDIAEDRMVTAAGSYSATAPITPSNPWIMQLVAFRTPSGGGTTPTVTSVSPNSGTTAGGTAVTITGTNFATGATVTFGGAAATNVVVVSSTSITATTPAGSAGAVTVSVTVSGLSGSLAGGFTYVATPTVTGVLPNSGSTAGGTAVTITGTNFVTGATVTFGGTPATNVVVASSTSITATTPAGSAGAVTVTVTANGQSGSLANGFTYTATVTVATPTFTPGAGTYGSAQSVSITSTTSGATICYTTNGSTPAANTPGTCSTGTALANGGSVMVSTSETLKAIGTENGFTNSAVGSASYTISTCVQNLAIGTYTLCGEAYNVITSGTQVTTTYSPSPGNGIIAWATWCYNSGCNNTVGGVTATIGDNINSTESCFTASPHSPFTTNANGGAPGQRRFPGALCLVLSKRTGRSDIVYCDSEQHIDAQILQLQVSEWKAGSLAASCSPISKCFESVDNLGEAGNTTGGTTATITTSGPTVNANDLIWVGTQIPCCTFTGAAGTGYSQESPWLLVLILEW